MYTEDDEEVELKKKNSNNNDYNDFYTSFSEMDEKEGKKEKKKKLDNEEISSEKDEEDYSDFYGTNDEIEEAIEKNGNNKVIIRIIAIILLVVILAVLLIILLKKGEEEPGDIELSKTSYTLKAGDKEHITYKVVDTDSNVSSKFTSSNPNVAIVNENGEITAVGKGEAIITITYTINGKTKEKECVIKVNGPEVKHELSLNLSSSATNWTNKDVTITVSTKTDTSITSLKYAVNCTSNCNYIDVKDNKIIVSNSGTTKVVVVAKDKSNLEVTKEITTKIDKEAPTITYTSGKTITSNKDISVCATCSDSLSGCKQNKVCKKYTSSKSNQVITVTDNAGNSKNSPSFNVVINKVVAPCTLKVSSDGTVSATLKESAVYYGFNSSYTGNNELSKKFTVGENGKSGAKVVYYYVKTKNGSTGSCYVTVIKECKSSTSCTYRAN